MTWVSPEQSGHLSRVPHPQPQPWLQVREITQLRRSLKISGHSAGRRWPHQYHAPAAIPSDPWVPLAHSSDPIFD